MELPGDHEAITMRFVYSPHPPPFNASGSSNVMSKKVKAGRVVVEDPQDGGKGWIFRLGDAKSRGPAWEKPVVVYQRRRKRTEMDSKVELLPVKVENTEDDDANQRVRAKRRVVLKNELAGLDEGNGSSIGSGSRLRKRNAQADFYCLKKKARNEKDGDEQKKRWIELSFEGVDPFVFIGLSCKVFWPIDDDWYTGSISKYNSRTKHHEVIYKDGDIESLILSGEKIKFYLSSEEMQVLNLKCSFPDTVSEASIYNEMVALAVSYGDCENLEPGDMVWAKLAGYPMWPAVIVNAGCFDPLSVPKPLTADNTISVQFFGTHDFARVNVKRVESFLKGLLSSFHLKCKQKHFDRSLEEATMYLCNQRLPSAMIQRQKQRLTQDSRNTEFRDEGSADSGDGYDPKKATETIENISTCPIIIGSLCIMSLGKIVSDSEYFHNRQYIWPEGYSASRKFISITNPNETADYKMEVVRNPRSNDRPLFRVTLDDGEQIEGTNPSVCWKIIYKRIRKASTCHSANVEESKLQKSGPAMFGFSNPKVSRLIQVLPNSTFCSKYFGKVWDKPPGYKPVYLELKDIDRCDVCHMDEEYEDNLFLQCDKCCMTVHARCYGEIEPSDGVLWFCNLCRHGAPESPPLCCLCPVIGGAIKPTTDGRWAHLTCAIWIPETCFLDIRKMEPVDGLCRINKGRWKLLCSLCGVSYGACIQCSNNNCYVAYHPLCARAAGLFVEPDNEDQHHLISDDDENAQGIRLLSFCKKHMPSRKDFSPVKEEPLEPRRLVTTYIPPSNPSGCSRCEPYDSFGRGQKEHHAIIAASNKRLFLDSTPYLISGCRQSGAHGGLASSDSLQITSFSGVVECVMAPQPLIISSINEKYLHMRATYRKRLAFGKSKVHGFGVFAKVSHKTGDMIVEYSGEVVRPRIADIREHRIYNSLVGAGTYMFHIDNDRVIDATRAGSIAHLINHSCEPNCYSRMFTVLGEEHIIICAKRDIDRWEELSYDYRFLSKDEQLACFCGFPKCRGVVNDVEALEQSAQLRVPRSELIPWTGD